MTPTSLLPQEAKVTGVDFNQLLREADREFHAQVQELRMKFEMGAIMKNMTLEHIAQACGGTYIGEECDREKGDSGGGN